MQKHTQAKRPSPAAPASAASPRPRHPGGRPRKFKEPCRAITMTLPQRVIDLLSTIDADRTKAVAKLADAFFAPSGTPRKAIDYLPLPDRKKLILVANSPTLRTLPWLHLVELSPARHLICLDHGIPTEKLELTLVDILESQPGSPERPFLSELLTALRAPRRSQGIAKGEIIFIDN